MNNVQTRLIDATADGALALTSNKRLARYLRSIYDREMQQRGKCVWPTPQIVSLDGWLSRNLAELGESWRLLDGFPALRLWEQVIEEDAAGSELELLQLTATARKAQEAHQLLVEYDCRLDGLSLTEDQRAFLRWQKRYLQRCQEHQWLDRAGLPGLIFTAMRNGQLAVPGQVLLTGFDQSNPALQMLEDVIVQHGGTVRNVQPELDLSARIHRHPCADARQEIEQASRWARRLLEQGAESIGIVVPDLQTHRSRIERVFREQIDPAASLSMAEDESAFSLSLGSPLAETGPIHAALEILATGFRMTIDQASFLLRTPYLRGGQAESDQRAKLDVWLRSFRQQMITCKRLAELAEAEAGADEIAKCLQTMLEGAGDGSRRTPGDWAGHFDRLLLDVGWPGERSLSSAEYQMAKAWQDKLLPALASLDRVSRPMDRSKALSLLRRLAGEIEFQLEAPTGAVQVVGLLESAGLDFEHLWVMGMGEDVLPAPARPNPFLPIDLQVCNQMPHASADRELDFARSVIDRLKAASPDVVFSYPLREGDCELRPSPLISALDPAELELIATHDPRQLMRSPETRLAEEADSRGPALTVERGEGGTGILKDQALCPFRAFVHYRLRGHELDRSQPGIDAMTRGDLLHRVLEYFWRDVGNQQRLLELGQDTLTDKIGEHVEQAIDDIFAGQSRPAETLLDLEKDRLTGLVGEWLTDVEAVRSTFEIHELEQEHFEQIGPLKIRTVVDRIDRLVDGSRVVLDYKTGTSKVDGLLGERLLEPQLPIYAVAASDSKADGVAFAQVRRGDCRMLGIARDDGLLPKVPGVRNSKPLQELGVGDWTQLLGYWRQQLEQLATDFVSGEARVDPVSYDKACQYCDLAGLCRIGEARYQSEPGEVVS